MTRVAILVLITGCSRLLGFDELAESTPNVGDATFDVARPDDGFQQDGPPSTGCPTDYTLVMGESKYRVVTNIATPWLTANTDCTNDNTSEDPLGNVSTRTHLIVISDEDEMVTIVEQTGTTGEDNMWIGLSDRISEGTFLPVTNEPTDGFPPASGPPWGVGQPANTGIGTDDCVQLVGNGQTGVLETLDCGDGGNYVCECDAFPVATMNF